MLKKTITYKDLDGNPVTEDFYFHMSKVEVTEMMFTVGSLQNRLKKIIASGDGGAIMAEFRKIIRDSYGRRSEDNRSFEKSEAISQAFLGSGAFDELFFELCTDPAAASDFINGILPPDMLKEMQSRMKAMPSTAGTISIDAEEDDRPAWIKENREPTTKEVMAMSPDELRMAFQRKVEQKKANDS